MASKEAKIDLNACGQSCNDRKCQQHVEIAKLKKEISELQMRLQLMENHANNLQAKASLPSY